MLVFFMERCYAYSIVATKKQTATLKRHIARTKKRASLAFIPKKENQYRPHLIRRYSLLVLIAIVIGLQFGYNFTPDQARSIGLSAMKLYFNAQNLVTWRNNSGFTPEAGGSPTQFGVDNGGYPLPVITTLGVNITF